MATVTTSLSVDFATLLDPGKVASADKTASAWSISGPTGYTLKLFSGGNFMAVGADGGTGTITAFQVTNLLDGVLLSATGLSLSLEDFLAAFAMPNGAQLATEYLFGQNDKITGNAGANLILGYGGQDVLYGEGGKDELSGGDGNDELFGDDGNDVLQGGAGVDYLQGGDGSDTLEGGGENDDLRGGADNDALKGGDGEDDLDGQEGNDTLTGGGDDDLDGDDGDDTLSGGDGYDDLWGGGNNDVLDGGGENDELNGGDGNDILDGGAGDDELNGDAGDDLLLLGAGDDGNWKDLFGGDGNDTVRFDGSVIVEYIYWGEIERFEFQTEATVTLSQNLVEAAYLPTETIAGSVDVNTLSFKLLDLTLGGYVNHFDFRGFTFETWEAQDRFLVTGTAIADTIFGPSVAAIVDGGGGNDVVMGGKGADRLTGGAGADTLIGGDGNDTYVADSLDAILEKAGGGTDTVRAAGSFSLANWLAIEHLAVLNPASTNAANLTGNALANTLTGNGGVNKLNGAGGNDVLRGGKGKDVLTGGDGNDRFDFTTALGAAHADTIKDMNERGNDTIRVDNAVFLGLKGGALSAEAFAVVTDPNAGADASDRILFDQGDGKLYFDRDGAGTKYKPLLFAIVDPNITLTVSDFAVI